MDDTYRIYLNRVARAVLPATHRAQLDHIQESPKFHPQGDGSRQASAFPGYTVISPPWEEDEKNQAFYKEVDTLQKDLLAELAPGLMIDVPPASFHMTLADLIWGSDYQQAAEQPNFEANLRECIATSFSRSGVADSVVAKDAVVWQLLGVMVMPRAIGVCLIPKDETSYDRTAQFRRDIYQNKNLIGLGVQQQYHFTAHITLGYFGEIPADLDRDRTANVLSAMNERWVDCPPPEIAVQRAELRKFDDMTRYYRQPDWPTFYFA